MKLVTYLQQTTGASRRAITAAIKQGIVHVNDTPIDSFRYEIHEGDTITRNEQHFTVAVSSTSSQLIAVHKPVGYVVSRADPHNPTIFELLPPGREKVYYPIGRLDKNSSGLLLLTNDPQQVHELLHPSKKLKKIYQVTVTPERNPKDTTLAHEGLRVDSQGYPTDPSVPESDFLRLTQIDSHGGYLEIMLEEGKKRHIRRLLKALGYHTITLQRIAFGKRTLGDMLPGSYSAIS